MREEILLKRKEKENKTDSLFSNLTEKPLEVVYTYSEGEEIGLLASRSGRTQWLDMGIGIPSLVSSASWKSFNHLSLDIVSDQLSNFVFESYLNMLRISLWESLKSTVWQ